ncbi:P-loop ATPase, Sll1717 family [Glutamicibacter arilaitensis]|uniref:P-loop ATPase, Sll1717 family n=1 Tax=Glutamicibacter arilaitensis TaxID=256701 RepID=UPI003F916439
MNLREVGVRALFVIVRRAYFTGAVRATRDISIALRQSRPAPVITFLRTDLWEKISFNDRNKMSQDIIYLDWNDKGLADVVDRRITGSLGIDPGTGWEQVFTTGEMRQRASAKTYILKRAMGRPRDVVAFATFARAEALNNQHAKIEATDIYEAEKR